MGARNTSQPAKALVAAKAPSARKKAPIPGAKRRVPRDKTVSAADKTAQKADRCQPYHHGDLHEALLRAAKRVAERDGLNGLTLRAVAREAGVSHAAPAHHFGDVTGLLSELAALGFGKFSAAMGGAAQAATSAEGAAQGRANAYVAFARDNPCLFQLMFRAERLDHERPALRESANKAFHNLAKLVGVRRGEEVQPDNLTLAQAADITRVWSLVHGFAMLYLDGRLNDILRASPPGTTEEMLLAAMLKTDQPAPRAALPAAEKKEGAAS